LNRPALPTRNDPGRDEWRVRWRRPSGMDETGQTRCSRPAAVPPPSQGPNMSRHPPSRRSDYRFFHAITTRWSDNDALQHVNNVVYFSYFDTAVTYFEMSNGIADLVNGPVRVVMAETNCRYLRSVAFPDRITVGLRAASIGRSSFRYDLAVFRNDEDEASAEGHVVRVFVESATQRPVPVPDASRAILETVLAIDRHARTA
jgi:acyl-CoA thioester hydrolase